MTKTIQEFVSDWNYQCQNADPQDEETLDELYLMLHEMFRVECDLDISEIPKYRFINDKAQIELVTPMGEQ